MILLALAAGFLAQNTPTVLPNKQLDGVWRGRTRRSLLDYAPGDLGKSRQSFIPLFRNLVQDLGS